MMECDEQGGTGPNSLSNGGISTAIRPPKLEQCTFDLETYISRYDPKSETRLQRLLFIAESTGTTEQGSSLARLAYEMAERQMRERGNTKRYRQVFGPLSTVNHSENGGASRQGTCGEQNGGEGPETVAMETAQCSGGGGGESSGESSGNNTNECKFAIHGISYNSAWVNATDQAAQIQLETLEARLSTAQAHMAKEAIRSAYVTLGDFHKSRGELKDALRCYLRSREYCTSQHQSGQMCLSVIELGLDMRNYAQVHSFVGKAEHTADLLASEPLVAAKLRVASGLALLADGRYASAAKKFTSVSQELTSQFGSVASAEDVALYGSLLGLASLDRQTLQRLVLDSSSLFQQRMELLPWMRDALQHFARAEYGPCLRLLESRRWEMTLDLHLSSHLPRLLQAVRDRCLVQYFVPYTSANLERMGRSFGMSSNDVEDSVAELIGRGDIAARINEREGTLMATRLEHRIDALRQVEKLGVDVIRETESMLLRMSCLEQDLVVQSDHPRNWRGDALGRRPRHLYGSGGRQYENDSSDDEYPLHDEAVMMDISDTGMNVSPER